MDKFKREFTELARRIEVCGFRGEGYEDLKAEMKAFLKRELVWGKPQTIWGLQGDWVRRSPALIPIPPGEKVDQEWSLEGEISSWVLSLEGEISSWVLSLEGEISPWVLSVVQSLIDEVDPNFKECAAGSAHYLWMRAR